MTLKLEEHAFRACPPLLLVDMMMAFWVEVTIHQYFLALNAWTPYIMSSVPSAPLCAVGRRDDD